MPYELMIAAMSSDTDRTRRSVKSNSEELEKPVVGTYRSTFTVILTVFANLVPCIRGERDSGTSAPRDKKLSGATDHHIRLDPYPNESDCYTNTHNIYIHRVSPLCALISTHIHIYTHVQHKHTRTTYTYTRTRTTYTHTYTHTQNR